MANNSSFADFIHDWEQLLAALDANGSDLPDVSVHRQPLEKVLAEEPLPAATTGGCAL